MAKIHDKWINRDPSPPRKAGQIGTRNTAKNRAGLRKSAGCASDSVTRRDTKTDCGDAMKAWYARGCV